MTRLPFNRQYRIALLLAFACVLALAAAGWHAIAQLRASLELTQHTREVHTQIDRVQIELLELERGQRAFMVTQDTADFEPYLSRLRTLHAEMDTLTALTINHAEQAPDLARLQKLVEQRRAALVHALGAQRGSGEKAVLAAIRQGEGKVLMAEIREVLDNMHREELRALVAHELAASAQVRFNLLLGAAVMLVTSGMLVAIFLLMRRELAARDRAERAEAEHRQLLELDVAQRSRELGLATDALKFSEARLRGVFESATDAILTVDESQTIVLANPAAARVLRMPQEELIGAGLDRFVPEPWRNGHGRWVKAFGASPDRPRSMGSQREVNALRADGELFPIEAAISHVHVEGQALYTVILRDVSELRRMQHELARSHADLQRLVSAQGQVQEEERRRIARELHDDLQQKLAAILMNLSVARDLVRRASAPARAALDAADELAGAAIESTRRIVNDLRPQVLDDLGLVAALQALAQGFSRSSGVACQVQADAQTAQRASHSADVATCLYRVAQESLTNVVKHSRASQVWIELLTDGQHALLLRVRDNGQGMALDSRRKPESFGLMGMQERLRRLGGTLEVHSQSGGGTTLEATLPTPTLAEQNSP